MSLTKPKVQRVYVGLKDPDTGENEHVTVYGMTIADVIEHLSTNTGQEPDGADQCNECAKGAK